MAPLSGKTSTTATASAMPVGPKRVSSTGLDGAAGVFHEALRDHLSKLRPRDQRRWLHLQRDVEFDQEGLEKVFQPLRSKYEASKFHKVMERAGKISAHILSFGRAIDVAVGGGGVLAAGLIWGGVRVLLEVSSRSVDFHDQILDMLESLSLYLPLVQDWTGLFPPSDHAELAHCLKKTCSAFVGFLVMAIRYFQRSSFANTLRLLFSPSLQAECTRSQQKIELYARHLDRYVNTAAVKISHARDNHILHVLETSSTKPTLPPSVPFPFRFIQNCIRNDQFFGRQEQMDQLDAVFFGQVPVLGMHSVVIHGLGGSGKSSLAKEYMYRRMDRYEVVLWIYADSTTKLDSQFIALASALGIVAPGGQARGSVLQWINHLSVPFLIVFDNADDPSSLAPYWPSSRHGSIIITSSNPSTREEGFAQHSVATPKFNNDTGERFLLSLLGDDAVLSPEDAAAVRALAEQYDGLPLCLRQAASFMRSKKCSPAHYLKLYQTRHAEIDAFPIPNYDKTVVTVWSMSMGTLSEDSRALLDVLAVFDPDSIPIELFHEADVSHEHGAFLTDSLRVLDAVGGLVAQSLVEFNEREKTLNIHRFFQTATFRKLGQNADRLDKVIHLAAELTCNSLPEPNLSAIRQPQRWKATERVLSHVFNVYSRGPSKISDAVSGKLLQSLIHIVNYGFESGQYALGERAFDKAEAVLAMAAAPDPNLVACLYYYHSRICAEECRLQDMLRSIQQAQRYFDDAAWTNPDLYRSALRMKILTMHGLANLAVGKFADSERYLRTAIQLCVQCGMEKEWSLGNLTQNLGSCYLWSGNLAQAERTLGEALTQPNENVEAAKYTMGNVMLHQGRYDEALALHREVLQMYSDMTGLDHLTTADSWHKVGCILSMAEFSGRDLREAQRCFEQNLRITLLPANAQNSSSGALIARAKWRLSGVLGDSKEAQELREDAMSYLKSRLGHEPLEQDIPQIFDRFVFHWSR